MVLRLTMLAVLLPLSDGLLISQQPRLPPRCRQAGASLRPSCRPCFMKAAGEAKAKAAAVEPLPSTLLPITLSVFAQMLGEGIAISSLPLYMTNLGASLMQVGLATSCFSRARAARLPDRRDRLQPAHRRLRLHLRNPPRTTVRRHLCCFRRAPSAPSAARCSPLQPSAPSAPSVPLCAPLRPLCSLCPLVPPVPSARFP